MKLVDRQPCEATQPVIYIGHRQYPKPGGEVYVSRTWFAEYCIGARHFHEALRTTNKQAAIRKAHEICRRIASGESKPRVFKFSMEELKTQYLELKRNEGRSPKTLEKYTFGMESFWEWSRDTGHPSAVTFTSRDFWAFNQWLADNGKSEKTRYDRLILVKQAFKWAAKEKLIAENPVVGQKVNKPEPNEQPCFTPEQVGTILAKADPHEGAIYAVMAYLGVRFGEARDLKWSDILWNVGANGFVVVRRGGSGKGTKNRKVRRIPLNPLLKPYLLSIPRKFDRVFSARPSKKYPEGGGPISERRLLLSLKSLCRRCEFANHKQYKLHTFRHAFASMCARTNVAYKYALEWMGHQSSEILDLYYTMYDDVAETAMKTIVYPTPEKPRPQSAEGTAA